MYGKSGEEAKQFVKKAIAFYKKAGKAVAMAEFTNAKGPFVEGEQYVFVLNLKGTMLSHGVNEKYIGQDFIDVKDSDGRSFVREIVDVANAKGKGIADYKWYNPKTKEDLQKEVYFEKVDDLIICSGIYIERLLDVITYNLQISSIGGSADSIGVGLALDTAASGKIDTSLAKLKFINDSR
jgi:signal transduction histidine kinase